MNDIEKIKTQMLNEARLMHARAYDIECSCDAIDVLSNRLRFGSTAIIESKARLRRWLDEYPSDVLPVIADGGDK